MTNNMDLFNKKMIEFLDDLIYILPNINDFQALKSSCQLLLAFNNNAIYEVFKHNIVDAYSEHIMNKDESFFLTQSYGSYTSDMNLIEKLKANWKHLDDSNKETIWKYMQVLIILYRRINAKVRST